jgi:hypothetical protein
MCGLGELQSARCEQGLDVGLDVVEIHPARGRTPLLGQRGPAARPPRRSGCANPSTGPAPASRLKQRPSSKTRTRSVWRLRLATRVSTRPPISVERMTPIWLAIGLARMIGAGLTAKSASHAASTKL